MQKENEKFTNKAIAEILRNVAAAYIIKNENRFRIIAYENTATTIEHMTRELRDIWQEGSLQSVPGIGPTISSHLDEYFKNGKSKHFDSVFKDLPAAMFPLMQIPSIGPKSAFKLVTALKLNDPKTVVKDLQYAAKQGRIAKIETFGEKSQQEILDSIALYEQGRNKVQRMPMPYAQSLAEELRTHLQKIDGVERIDFLGSLRRHVATIGDIDVAVGTSKNNEKEIVAHFIAFKRAISVDNQGDRKASIIVSPNIRIDLRVQDLKTYGSMLQYFTGSKSHNIKLREHAIKKGLSLNEYGITEKSKPLHTFDTEKKLYNFLGLSYIEPEMREGTNEVNLALANKLPMLIEKKDLKGDLHIHSSYDLDSSHDIGAHSYLDIAKKAEELGYEYVGFADHNPSTKNNSPEKVVEILKKRKEHIQEVFKKHPVKVQHFIGLEIDILPSGDLAIPQEAFEHLDYAIVSLHSAFRLPIDKMTARVLKALSCHPKVRIFGHPTGRLLGKREGVDLDWKKVFEVTKKNDIALEINSGPDRLDLPDSLVREAITLGNKCIIDTDAHAAEFMPEIGYGVSVARRGWCTKNDIINTKSLKEFKSWLMSS